MREKASSWISGPGGICSWEEAAQVELTSPFSLMLSVHYSIICFFFCYINNHSLSYVSLFAGFSFVSHRNIALISVFLHYRLNRK